VTNTQWQHLREAIAIVAGAAILIWGGLIKDPAMMTIGAGLVGFSPAAKGPGKNGG
jgi:hypothetical protein